MVRRNVAAANKDQDTMSKHQEIYYGDKFGTLFVGIPLEGKTLDTEATERRMQSDLDKAMTEWNKANPEPDREVVSARAYIEWEDSQRSAFDRIGVQFSQDPNWYDSNLVWIDAE